MSRILTIADQSLHYPYNFKYISLSDYHNILNDKPEGYVEPEWFGGVSW